jgi:hypothetical protein
MLLKETNLSLKIKNPRAPFGTKNPLGVFLLEKSVLPIFKIKSRDTKFSEKTRLPICKSKTPKCNPLALI